MSALELNMGDKRSEKKKASRIQSANKQAKKAKAQQEDVSLEVERKDVLLEHISKQFIIEKGLFLFEGQLPPSLTSPIKGLGWQEFFKGLNVIKPDVINLFYNGEFNTEKNYAIVKGKKVNYWPKTINALFKLNQTAVGHPISREPTDRDMQDALDKVAWPEEK